MTAQQWEGISLPLTKMDRQIAYGMEIYNGYSVFFFLSTACLLNFTCIYQWVLYSLLYRHHHHRFVYFTTAK